MGDLSNLAEKMRAEPERADELVAEYLEAHPNPLLQIELILTQVERGRRAFTHVAEEIHESPTLEPLIRQIAASLEVSTRLLAVLHSAVKASSPH